MNRINLDVEDYIFECEDDKAEDIKDIVKKYADSILRDSTMYLTDSGVRYHLKIFKNADEIKQEIESKC